MAKQDSYGILSAPVLPDERMGMDVEAFDHVIKGKGIPLLHTRVMKCPIGLIDPSDVRRVHEDHSSCVNGLVRIPVGRVIGSFTSNETSLSHADLGYFDGSSVICTFTRFYEGAQSSERVLVRPYDVFYVDDPSITTGTWGTHQRRIDGKPDRAEFPIIQAKHLLDSAGVWYYQNIDFDISADGDLVWRDSKGPAVGTVYSVFYTHRPYWIVERLLHEIRLFPVAESYLDPSVVKLERSCFSAVLVREYAHRTNTPDAEAPAKTQHTQKLPPDLDSDAI